MADDGEDEHPQAHDNGGGPGEEEDEALAVAGGLSLMQLELSEEDQPAVVPYEEVRCGVSAMLQGRGGDGSHSIYS